MQIFVVLLLIETIYAIRSQEWRLSLRFIKYFFFLFLHFMHFVCKCFFLFTIKSYTFAKNTKKKNHCLSKITIIIINGIITISKCKHIALVIIIIRKCAEKIDGEDDEKEEED